MAAQSLMYTPMRSILLLHLQVYALALEYGSQLPLILPRGPIYGHGINPHAMHVYQQGMLSGRCLPIKPLVSLRSPLLDGFRTNQTHKWELQVRPNRPVPSIYLNVYNRKGPS
jgi:hypothetical protein